jgi:hypothetical protein
VLTDLSLTDQHLNGSTDYSFTATSERGVEVELFDKTRVDAAGARLTFPATGATLGFQMLGAATTRSAHGAVATAEVGPVKAIWTSYTDRVKEQLVLSSRPAGDRLSFAISDRGLTYATDGRGGYLARERDGQLRFHVLAPTVVDATGKAGTASLTLEEHSATIHLASSFLDTSVYPLVVDPTVVFGSIDIDGSPVAMSITATSTLAQRRSR